MRRVKCKEIAAELKIAILYRDENDGAVPILAELLGLTRRTIYAYLDGEIKMSIDFLHAAVLATNGDPDIKKFLEPKGWELNQKEQHEPPTDDPERELGDIHIASSKLHNTWRDANQDAHISLSEKNQILRQAQEIKDQVDEVVSLVEKRV